MWKYLAGAAAVAALLFGVYEWGHSSGYEDGYPKGQKSRDKEVQGFKDQLQARDRDENQRREADNKKISDLELQSQNAASANRALQKLLEAKQSTIITQYVKDNPQQATTCAITPATVKAANALLLSGGS
ncbi:hypothetical protein [Burkholderia phage BCSR5]|nr:hypothetical protein [Burkholderia phage BCSR5]